MPLAPGQTFDRYRIAIITALTFFGLAAAWMVSVYAPGLEAKNADIDGGPTAMCEPTALAESHECRITCLGTACEAPIVCPPGMPCLISCIGHGSCRGAIDCAASTSCAVVCTGNGSCAGTIRCVGPRCTVECAGEDSCRSWVLVESPSTYLACKGPRSCAGHVECSGTGQCIAETNSGAAPQGICCTAATCVFTGGAHNACVGPSKAR